MIIYHNPRCRKSRETLELVTNKGFDPEIRLYLENPLNENELSALLQKLGMTAEQLMRKAEPEYKLHVKDKIKSEMHLIRAIVQYPKLLERPILEVNEKAAIGRPPENVLKIIPSK